MKYIYVSIICSIINITKDEFVSHNIIELRYFVLITNIIKFNLFAGIQYHFGEVPIKDFEIENWLEVLDRGIYEYK